MTTLDLIRWRFWKLVCFLTSNPLKIAQIWRRLGVEIGENSYIYRDVVLGGGGKEPISIGSNCVLTGCALIPHDASTNRQLGILPGQPSPTAKIVVEDNCFIGYGAIVLMGVTIGEGAIVGAGSVVTKNVPPNSVVAGNPAVVISSTDRLIEKRKEEWQKHHHGD